MPDPIESIIANAAEVDRLWRNARREEPNRDVMPIPSRVGQVRAQYRDMPDDQIAEQGALGIVAQVNRVLDREEEKTRRLVRMQESRELREAEDRDRLIVRPERGGDEEEERDRWDEAFDGGRK